MIEAMFSDSDLDRWFEVFEDNAILALREKLQEAGEYFIKSAREFKGFEDQTGNLRSSIGYVIANNGSIVVQDLEKSSNGTAGAEGVEKAFRLAQAVASTHGKGLVLIGVAGMEYAVYVEALENKEVISGSSLRTEMWLRDAIKTIFERAW